MRGGSQENLGGGGHNVRQARFTVQFAGILGRPHPGGADDALLPELLFIRPRQRVTRQGGQTVVRVTEGGGFCEKEKKKRTSGLKCGTGKKKSEFNVNKWFPKVEDADRGHGWGAGGVKDKDGIQTEAAHLK